MPQDIKKPIALIQEEQTIRAKYAKPYDALTKKREAVDAEYSEKAYLYESQKTSLYSEAELKKSEVYSERAALIQKREEEVKSAWSEHGWSQEKENAYRKQENKKGEAAHTDPVNAQPKPKAVEKVVRAPAESPRAISQRQEINEAILNYFDAGMFNSKENLLTHIKQLDKNAPHTNVVVSEDGERAVSLSSNGKIYSYHAKLHPMGASEDDHSLALDAVKKFVKEHDFKGLSEERMLEIVTNGASGIRDDKGSKLTAIILDDHKHVLLANDQGGYEVLDIKPDVALPAPLGAKPAAAATKTK